MAQLVARIVRDDEAVGSSPATPTTAAKKQYLVLVGLRSCAGDTRNGNVDAVLSDSIAFSMVKNHGVRHLAIIMDGNRRWAKRRGLPTLAGHRRGYDVVLKMGDWCLDRGIEILTVYAFSSENWKRPSQEVEGLMSLLAEYLKDELPTLQKNQIEFDP